MHLDRLVANIARLWWRAFIDLLRVLHQTTYHTTSMISAGQNMSENCLTGIVLEKKLNSVQHLPAHAHQIMSLEDYISFGIGTALRWQQESHSDRINIQMLERLS